MATTKDYRDFILEQLNLLDNITCKSMMGEYLLYYNGLLFGGIYDDRLLIKIVDSNKKYNMQESIIVTILFVKLRKQELENIGLKGRWKLIIILSGVLSLLKSINLT